MRLSVFVFSPYECKIDHGSGTFHGTRDRKSHRQTKAPNVLSVLNLEKYSGEENTFEHSSPDM